MKLEKYRLGRSLTNVSQLISCTILNKGRVGTAHPTKIALLQLVQDVSYDTLEGKDPKWVL